MALRAHQITCCPCQGQWGDRIFMITDANVVADALVMGSMQAKLHIPQ
jgi:hypothetical protein